MPCSARAFSNMRQWELTKYLMSALSRLLQESHKACSVFKPRYVLQVMQDSTSESEDSIPRSGRLRPAGHRSIMSVTASSLFRERSDGWRSEDPRRQRTCAGSLQKYRTGILVAQLAVRQSLPEIRKGSRVRGGILICWLFGF